MKMSLFIQLEVCTGGVRFHLKACRVYYMWSLIFISSKCGFDKKLDTEIAFNLKTD